MASYTDNRNALFASERRQGPAPAEEEGDAKAPLSLGGPSAAAVAKKKEQEAALRSKGDALFAEAEALMPPRKTGFAGLMAKKPNPLFAAPKYAAAAAAYASAKARPLAVAAYGKAAACHASPDRADGGRAAAWADAGEALRAAETALRCGTETLDQRAAPTRAMDLVARALDYADARRREHACQPDVARKALGWYARRGLLDDAISTVSKHVKALADANLDPGPALYGLRASAKAAEDLLVAFKPGIRSRARQRRSTQRHEPSAPVDADVANLASASAARRGIRHQRRKCRAGGMDNSLDFSMSQSGAVDFPSVNTPSKKDALAVGAAVEARHNGGRKWYGQDLKAHDDGTFDVAYDDGDRESGVVKEFVRPAGGSPRRSRARANAPRRVASARYRGKSKFYPGKIARPTTTAPTTSPTTTASEANVIEALIRPLGGAGMAALARRQDNGDGTYDIDYDDGEGVERRRGAHQSVSGGAAAAGTGGAAVGAKVEARYRKSKYYAGVIAKDNGDGTYDIDYDDGEKESKVAEALIKASAAAAAAAPAAGKGGAFAVGAKVEARYRGKSKYCVGVIAKDNGDGTYDIDYDDGEKESKERDGVRRRR
ncbi:tudor domain-containing protein [Aureococcus anophagefferens]|nr:tudor domain-containing protein [Aureococcus anophagefferens]